MNESVKRILDSTSYCTLATVSEDGSPWNVPVRFAYDENNFYFRSPPGTMHGLNIERDEKVSAVIFDTHQSIKGAVYLHSFAQQLHGVDEQEAIRIFNDRFNNPPDQWETTYYFKIPIGELDTDRSVAEMYYFRYLSTI